MVMRVILTSDTHYGYSENHTANYIENMLKKIVSINPDVLIHAGDWGSNAFAHVRDCMELFRKYLPTAPMLSCIANHDVWRDSDETKLPILENRQQILDLFKEYNLLNELLLDDVLFLSYNGWYASVNPPSNDASWILGGNPYSSMFNPKAVIEMHSTMKKLGEEDFERMLRVLNKSTASKKVVSTHFSPFYRNHEITKMSGSWSQYETLLDHKVDVICYGHSHFREDIMMEKSRILNAGSDYNKPDFILFEV
jgi:predicted phosphodiesterase